jgi:hypothetical protein
MNIYDRIVERTSLNVTVYDIDPYVAEINEIVCPGVVLPGSYFNCHIDVPYGSNDFVKVDFIDDITNETSTTDWMALPGESC